MCFFNVIFPFSKRKIFFGRTTESININGELKEKKYWSIRHASANTLQRYFHNIELLHRHGLIVVSAQTINDIFIMLIPGIPRLELIRHLQPISLCNVPYKIVMNLIANRLRALMPNLVAPNQVSTFVASKHMQYNIVIAQVLWKSIW